MAPATPRLRILSVGGNAVSAFLSWRLQATNTCDVTLVWKSGFEHVAQYGISMKSKLYGNERFKPRAVVRSPEEAASHSKAPFDYVFLCVKALPDVYDIASVIESVVSPQHTCILINTTHSLGVESFLEQRFPTNVVLSLVSGAELQQLGASEFEHTGSTEIWVGPASENPSIPPSIQSDMADALAMTLGSGQVDCKVSPNIRQQQYERMIGNIAFHPPSVLFETANHAELIEKVGVRSVISGVIDELLQIAAAQGCQFGSDFKDKTIEAMTRPQEANSTMYQDFAAKRPMEVETYLGSPMKLAQEVNVPVPRIETLYAMLHHTNIINQQRPAAPVSPQQTGGHPPRMSSTTMSRGPPPNGMNGMNGHPMKGSRPGSRAPSMTGGIPAPGMRRGPPPPNGFPPRGPPPMGNGYGGPPGPPMQRRPSLEGNDLEEFSHLMLYDTVPEDGDMPVNGMSNGGPYPGADMSNGDLALRERELALRQKELALREREYHMRAGPPGPRRPMPPASHAGDFDEDDDGDFFDPMAARAPPAIDPDNFDMLSVTSRRTRKAPSAQQLRKNPEMGGPPGPPVSNGRGPSRFGQRPGMNKRTSARLMSDVPGLHDSIMNNALIGYSSDRYGNVDRANMGQQSRTNSLTAARLDEMAAPGYGAYPQGRRASQSPGNPLSPGRGRPSPPGGYPPYANGQPNGRPSPPGMRQPVPRHPPGHGNAVAPQQVEQHVGVSNPQSKRGPQVRSLTGSASASAESGDSGASALVDSEPSAASSQSSLGPRPQIGVR
ncbi:alcohol dehydrogenase [Diplodia corticola]|uniref:Alcohol dehydrogenase n=1 Tax=Diplodia corticola TaxID=236234 RepID=A0A1J9R3P4_9PEZI|nr:alcohol dehydrogenase [Diplodia corticola]OJD35232.1 alcohol dehydrogenase [Diplodia corticola]